jgi:hypothetical protein
MRRAERKEKVKGVHQETYILVGEGEGEGEVGINQGALELMPEMGRVWRIRMVGLKANHKDRDERGERTTWAWAALGMVLGM